jgi:UDP-N-acetylglucosamine 2-epimerase
VKLLTIVGTRPELIRLSCVIQKCDEVFQKILVHTGQNWDYTLSEIFFSELGLRKPDYQLSVSGAQLGETMGNIIAHTYPILQKEKPDALLVLGDTNSALSAIGAKRLKVPIFHMEAGNRCFDQNVPEEINRKIIDHIADVNLAYTEHGRRNLLEEGLPRERVFVTGSPMPEVLARYRHLIDASPVMERLGLEKKKFILVSAHREENLDNSKNLIRLVTALNAVAAENAMPLVLSTHPRTAKKITEHKIEFYSSIRSIAPLGFLDYVKLQTQAFCTLSDSGTLSEESAILGFPAVLLRTSTERPEAVDKGSIVVGGIRPETVCKAVQLAVRLDKEEPYGCPSDYRDTNVSSKVVRIILGYASIVDKFVWQKDFEERE